MSSAPDDNEWRLGWRIAGASALANATGISLLFYTFNMFLLPMSIDLGLTRGQTGTVQALVIMAALSVFMMRIAGLQQAGSAQDFLASRAFQAAMRADSRRFI